MLKVLGQFLFILVLVDSTVEVLNQIFYVINGFQLDDFIYNLFGSSSLLLFLNLLSLNFIILLIIR